MTTYKRDMTMTTPSPAPAPTNQSVLRIVDVVDRVAPDPPATGPMAAKLRRQKEIIMVGCAWEMPTIRPSYPELGYAIGISHTTAMQYLKAWHDWPWRERYGWLQLTEGRLACETNTVDASLLR